ncbi:MAG: hypothetical protein CL916_00705 [Deltaproteobacteria bacterium]|nr:hypothetical protein [Deltaproteobacteria bacterium]
MRYVLLLLGAGCANPTIKSAEELNVNDFDDTAAQDQNSSQPSSEPEQQPANEPNPQPAAEPSTQPSSEPSTQPASEPSTQPASEPDSQSNGIMLYYTDRWDGSWTYTETTLNGSETYTHAYFTEQPNTLDCDMSWSLSGVAPTTASCTDCLFEFDITATFNTTSISALDCEDFAADLTFSYAYHENYTYTDSNGTSIPLGATLLYKDTNGWSPFVAPNNPNIPTEATFTSSLSIDEAAGQFSYTNGFLNYEYYYGY